MTPIRTRVSAQTDNARLALGRAGARPSLVTGLDDDYTTGLAETSKAMPMTRFLPCGMALLCAAFLAGCDSDSHTAVSVVFEDAAFPVAVDTGIKYGEGERRSGPNVDLLMDVYTPVASGETPRPAMIVVHGGAWAIGDKANTSIVTLADFYASRGFVTFSINYRMTGDDPADAPQWWLDIVSSFLDEPTQRASYAAMVDTATAVRFVRANAAALGVAPDHIFAEGSSAGAFNVVHVGLDDPALYASALPVNNPEELSRDRKSTRLNSSHIQKSRMPSSA